jgi:hypothetical protein
MIEEMRPTRRELTRRRLVRDFFGIAVGRDARAPAMSHDAVSAAMRYGTRIIAHP